MKRLSLLLFLLAWVFWFGAGRVEACQADGDCDDGNPCTVDSCQEGSCVNDASGTDGWACDDLDPCTMEDACLAGTCTGAPLDADGDGHVSEDCGGDDCDDQDPAVNPGMVEGPEGDETCTNAVDDDCDGYLDQDDPGCIPCVDQDGDGYGAPASENCEHPEEDCNDENPEINPGVLEGPPGDTTCADGKDNDCDGFMDKDDSFCIGSILWNPSDAEASPGPVEGGSGSGAWNLVAVFLLSAVLILGLKKALRGR